MQPSIDMRSKKLISLDPKPDCLSITPLYQSKQKYFDFNESAPVLHDWLENK